MLIGIKVFIIIICVIATIIDVALCINSSRISRIEEKNRGYD